MTKVLSAVLHRDPCKRDFDLDAMPAASIVTHSLKSTRGRQSLGGGREGPDDVLSCSCATAQLLSRLVCESQVNVFAHDMLPVVRNGGAREI